MLSANTSVKLQRDLESLKEKSVPSQPSLSLPHHS